MRTLLEYEFADVIGTPLTETIRDELRNYFDVAMPLLQKLSEINFDGEPGIISLAVNQ